MRDKLFSGCKQFYHSSSKHEKNLSPGGLPKSTSICYSIDCWTDDSIEIRHFFVNSNWFRGEL